MNSSNNKFGYILNIKVSSLSFTETIDQINNWVIEGKSKYICIANTHSLVSAGNDSQFFKALNKADLVTPDGMPLVWALRKLGFSNQERVDGPRLMEELCKSGYKVYLYGSTSETLCELERKLIESLGAVEIVGKYSPPFRELSEVETSEIIANINATSPDLVFVGLGCPKQEKWMNINSKRINSVLLGVGAAFDFLAGKKKRPHIFIQKLGLEWLYRLVSEPKRLWKRYFYNNPIYIYRYIMSFRMDKRRTLGNIRND